MLLQYHFWLRVTLITQENEDIILSWSCVYYIYLCLANESIHLPSNSRGSHSNFAPLISSSSFPSVSWIFLLSFPCSFALVFFLSWFLLLYRTLFSLSSYLDFNTKPISLSSSTCSSVSLLVCHSLLHPSLLNSSFPSCRIVRLDDSLLMNTLA